MPKNPHAVALGRKGGQARTAALSPAERSRIARLGGRPTLYRTIDAGRERAGRPYPAIVLQRHDGHRWLTLDPPYDEPAKAYLRRQRRSAQQDPHDQP